MARIFIALIVIALFTLTACTAPPEDANRAEVVDVPEVTEEATTGEGEVPIDFANSEFKFIGYGPGKSHVGTFTQMEGFLTIEDGTLTGARGVIQASSVQTDSKGVDNHLRTEDFFHVEEYPTIEVQTRSIEDGNVIADLTFHGVTQTLSFPASVDGNSITGETVISMEQFGISHPATNDEVSISFKFTA